MIQFSREHSEKKSIKITGNESQFCSYPLDMCHNRIMKPTRIYSVIACLALIPLMGTYAIGKHNAVISLTDILSNGMGQHGTQSLVMDFIRSLHSEESKVLIEMENKNCAAHIQEWSTRLTQGNWSNESKWVPQMIDSWGKVPEGILSGHINALGDFDECINIQVKNLTVTYMEDNSIAKSFEGRYCTSYIVDYNTSMEAAGLLQGSKKRNSKINVFMSDGENEIFQESVSIEELLQTIFTQVVSTTSLMIPSVAICLPNSCSQEDIQYLLTRGLKELYENLPGGPETKPFPLITTCEEKTHVEFSAADIFMIIFLTGLIVLSLTTGVIDYYCQTQGEHGSSDRGSIPLQNNGLTNRYLMAFSIYTNTKKWLSTRKSAEDFGCLHGIRFLSTCWVVLCHGYFVFGMVPQWNMIDIKKLQKAWTMMPILNGTFSVDSFFVMSGMLATYNILKLLDKNNGKMNIFMFYVHRYIRLTPTYAILIGIMATLVVYSGNGPLWSGIEAQAQLCRDNWWTNLLYINNIVKADEPCNGESWYLANDMQFYILAPFIVYPLWKWQYTGIALLGFYTLLSCISPALVVHFNNAAPAAIFTADAGEDFTEIYQRPWSRIQTFLAGIWLGWILYKTRGKRVVIPKLAVAALWITSTALVVTVIYAIHPWFDPGYTIPNAAGYFYAALSRFTYAVGLCWVIFACIKGYGGVVNKFLSWKAFMPLGRLTFCVYLTSIHIQMIFHIRLSVLLKYDTYTMVNLFFAHMVMSLLVGYVCTILFESPFIVLHKLIFEGPAKKSEPNHKKDSGGGVPSKRYGIFYNKEDTIIPFPDKMKENTSD